MQSYTLPGHLTPESAFGRLLGRFHPGEHYLVRRQLQAAGVAGFEALSDIALYCRVKARGGAGYTENERTLLRRLAQAILDEPFATRELLDKIQGRPRRKATR